METFWICLSMYIDYFANMSINVESNSIPNIN
jgi:hypothetical protein